jgi:hypothetical protein
MRRFERWTFHFGGKQLKDLKNLSQKASVPQSVFAGEGLNYILKKYRYILTMKKFDPEEARYLLSGSRDVDTEERPFLKGPFSSVKKRKGGV